MKLQKDFDWFKLVITLMFAIGIGGLLLSVFFTVRLYWSDNKSDFESVEENQETSKMPPQTTSESAFKRDSSGPSNKQDDEKENQEMPASLDSVVHERSSPLNSETERAVGALTEESDSNEAPERRILGLSVEEAHRRGAELKVELENLLDTSVEMKEEIVSGVALASKIPDEVAKEREFERLRELAYEQAELNKKILELEGTYVVLSGDWEAEKPGGWIYEIKQILHLGDIAYE